jgi:hypothetical protein
MNEKNIMLLRSENLKRRSHLEGLGVNGRIILKWILNRIMCFGMDPFAAGERPVEWIMVLCNGVKVSFEPGAAKYLSLRRRKASRLKITF